MAATANLGGLIPIDHPHFLTESVPTVGKLKPDINLMSRTPDQLLYRSEHRQYQKLKPASKQQVELD